jgi:hypothetical protein
VNCRVVTAPLSATDADGVGPGHSCNSADGEARSDEAAQQTVGRATALRDVPDDQADEPEAERNVHGDDRLEHQRDDHGHTEADVHPQS